MARLALTALETLGSKPTLQPTANSADLTWTAAGANFADGFSFPWTGNEVLLVRNDNGAPQTVTITSTALAKFKRTGDITTYSVGAAELAVFGPFKADGWRQSADGKVYGAASAADVYLAVVKLKFS